MATPRRGNALPNIAAKKKRIASGSGERMRSKGSKGAPTDANFVAAAKTVRKPTRKTARST